ncbi:hypothetical protein OHS33_32130 [Streptomyces sp. NBC_00536]|uniref:hypothetical protein n=1 Tax=Streptomyces sp. NBC_00536 TaxID=2975769 RepID=UPI002E8175AC|nr:hypothetical protein [Streptomyces sp. NBC_00536]WUC82603.1 hypothetical protein OHS33_32130 [Streptomyces sp. NBC_00536]
MLDGAMAALAASVGSAVVQAAGTDAWTAFRDRLARLLGRGDGRRDGERAGQAETAQLARLDRTAAELAAAGGDGGGSRDTAAEQRARHVAAWRTRTEDLLEELEPDERAVLAAELRALLDGAAQAVRPAAGGVAHNVFHGPAAVQSGDRNVQVNRFDSRP